MYTVKHVTAARRTTPGLTRCLDYHHRHRHLHCRHLFYHQHHYTCHRFHQPMPATTAQICHLPSYPAAARNDSAAVEGRHRLAETWICWCCHGDIANDDASPPAAVSGAPRCCQRLHLAVRLWCWHHLWLGTGKHHQVCDDENRSSTQIHFTQWYTRLISNYHGHAAFEEYSNTAELVPYCLCYQCSHTTIPSMVVLFVVQTNRVQTDALKTGLYAPYNFCSKKLNWNYCIYLRIYCKAVPTCIIKRNPAIK